MNNATLTIACAKGYLWDQAQLFLKKMGIVFDSNLDQSRQLSMWDQSGRFQLMKIRPWDVPVYVEEGAADVGIVGKDVISECKPDIIELLDLHYGGCRLVIAGPKERQTSYLTHHIRVATKYSQSTLDYFAKKSIRCIPIPLYGAMELAPSTGVSDIICDLTASGQTLTDNGLIEFDEVMSSTARLVANRVSMMTKHHAIHTIWSQLRDQVRASINA